MEWAVRRHAPRFIAKSLKWEALRDIADDLVRALDRAREAKNVDTHEYEIARGSDSLDPRCQGDRLRRT